MRAVLGMVSICWMSPERLAAIVLSFQLAMPNAGNFFLFLCGLLGAVLNSPLVEYFVLSFLQPRKQADRGGSAPYWLRVGHLWRAVADQ